MPNLLLVMLGGAIGAGLAPSGRRGDSGPLRARAFPGAHLIVNLIGGLAIGLLAGWLARSGGSEQMRLFVAVGVLGGFTTFSAFSLETFLMIERGQLGFAATYVDDLGDRLGAAALRGPGGDAGAGMSADQVRQFTVLDGG